MDRVLEIPIVHCFDDNYSAPAAVAFLTMLENASPDAFYKIYVIHNDISEKHREMLSEIVGRFSNASLIFIVPDVDVSAMWRRVGSKGHFSKDIICKLLIADIFPTVNRIIVADVDVVYRDDIGKVYRQFLSNGQDYIYGSNYGREVTPSKWLKQLYATAYNGFSESETSALKDGVGAGFMVYNLDLMRKDGIPKKALEFFLSNANRIWQPEQDTLNIICKGRIAYMPPEALVCTYLFDVLNEDEKACWQYALDHPIQLHYATASKPWIMPNTTMSHFWWSAIARTPFFYEVAPSLSAQVRKEKFGLFWGTLPLVKIWHIGTVKKVSLLGIISLAKRK